MERIDQQQLCKKPIPAICEHQGQAQPEPAIDNTASAWLGSAMAVWMRDDGVKRTRAADDSHSLTNS